jgi:GMP synthase (glutamine-hydrolysing)
MLRLAAFAGQVCRRPASTASTAARPTRRLRILIVDGYAEASRREFATVGLPLASVLYSEMILSQVPRDVVVDFETVFPCTPDYTAPREEWLAQFDGCCFTGSSYSAYDDCDDVTRQIDLLNATFESGVSSFGSCWGLQVAAVAMGGTVELSQKGREVGIGRKIALTQEGRGHPMFAGKKTAYEAFMSHGDEVTRIPREAVVLSGNDHTRVQAMSVTKNGVESWFVQYHPEYNLSYYAGLIGTRGERMIGMGFFHSPEDHQKYVDDMTDLSQDPERKDLRWKYGIDDDLISNDIKQAEVRNWLKLLLTTGWKN